MFDIERAEAFAEEERADRGPPTIEEVVADIPSTWGRHGLWTFVP